MCSQEQILLVKVYEYFSIIYQRKTTFMTAYLFPWVTESFQMGLTLKAIHLLPWEQIHSFKS